MSELRDRILTQTAASRSTPHPPNASSRPARGAVGKSLYFGAETISDLASQNPGSSALPTYIDRHATAAFALLSLFYFGVTAALSSLKLLWLDELITVNIARLGSVRAIWQALSAGADPNPPLTHIAVLASSRLFGPHAYAYRLPAILGYWAALLGLFLFLKRRVPPTWALTGVLICMGMGGFEWSFDCRSYALFFGTTMLALLCWSTFDYC